MKRGNHSRDKQENQTHQKKTPKDKDYHIWRYEHQGKDRIDKLEKICKLKCNIKNKSLITRTQMIKDK